MPRYPRFGFSREPRTGFLVARAVFPTAFFVAPAFVFAPAFFGAAFFFASFALSAFLTGFTFLPVVLLVCFFLVFFLAAIGAVYHRSAIPSAGARMPRPGRGAEMERREERSLHYGRDDKRLRVEGTERSDGARRVPSVPI